VEESERKRMIQELEAKIPGFNNPVTRIALDKSMKQYKILERQLGTKSLQAAIDSQKLNQDQKDYIYLRMNWL
jgi:hypothetical protein